MSAIKLTEKQQYWLEHVEQAQSQGLSMSGYAKQHGLNLKLFYNMKGILQQKGVLSKTEKAMALLPVQINQAVRESSHCRVSLPNGVVIEFTDNLAHGGFDSLLKSASQL